MLASCAIFICGLTADYQAHHFFCGKVCDRLLHFRFLLGFVLWIGYDTWSPCTEDDIFIFSFAFLVHTCLVKCICETERDLNKSSITNVRDQKIEFRHFEQNKQLKIVEKFSAAISCMFFKKLIFCKH